jgi:exopolysaccharide biosynthesis polyprenyl glycosylphosphotransferase
LKKEYHKFYFLISDFTAALIAWFLFNFFRDRLLNTDSDFLSQKWILSALLIGFFWITFFAFIGFYNNIYGRSRIKEFLKLITSTFLGCIIIFFLLLIDDSGIGNYTFYYKTFGLFYILQFSVTAFFKLILLAYIKTLVRNKKVLFNTILIGSGSNAKEIYDAVERNRELLGINFVGYFHSKANVINGMSKNLTCLGDINNLSGYIEKYKPEHVVIAVEQDEHMIIPDLLKILNSYKIRVSIIPDIYDLLLGAVKVNHVFSVPLIEINQDLIPVWQKAIKRTLDITVSFMVLSLGFPVLLIISLITKFSSKGPVFYSQVRIGKNGIPFKIYKFRSMYENAEKEGPALSSPHDPRITPWGRFMRRTKIDEFPQFYNVFIGQMSLVGPRPERQYFIDQIVKIAPHYKHLQRVKPGLTSLGQVKFGYAENVDQMVKRLKYDIIYIENMSLAMDFQIILYTLLIMISGRNR